MSVKKTVITIKTFTKELITQDNETLHPHVDVCTDSLRSLGSKP